MRFIYLALLIFCLPAAAAQNDMTAKVWLKSMSQALKQQQFKISFIKLQAGQIGPFVYIHGKIDQQEVALLERLNGPSKTVVRVDNKVTFIGHDQPAYTVQSDRIQGVLPTAFSGDIGSLERGYQFVLGGKYRLAGRPSQLIRIIPNDNNRYSYQVWLDSDTYLPLRYEILNLNKQIMEQILVVELNVLKDTPEILQRVYQQDWPMVLPQPPRSKGGNNWKFNWLPQGFVISTKDNHRLIGSHEAVEYIALSDGLVNISVYIAKEGNIAMPKGLMTRNGLSLATAHIGKAEVVVIGKIPVKTLTRIAESISNQ